MNNVFVFAGVVRLVFHSHDLVSVYAIVLEGKLRPVEVLKIFFERLLADFWIQGAQEPREEVIL